LDQLKLHFLSPADFLIDDYRQVTFVIEAEDGGDHGRFTGPIDKSL